MAEGGSNDGNSSRQPHDMRGLLRFCTDLTKVEDTTHPTQFTPLDQEKREFLEKVFTGLQGNDIKFMAECLEKLSSSAVNTLNEDISEQENALDNLSEFIDDIDYATDVYKLNGFPILVNCIKSPHASIKKRAAEVIGMICQNNEICQKEIIPMNVLPLLLNILDTHEDSGCKVKALYALSCIVREYEPAEDLFIQLSGLSYLMRAIQTQDSKLIIKSAFLLNYFISKNDKYKETLLSMGFIEQFIIVLFCDQIENDSREFCLRSLLNLCSTYKNALSECLQPEFQFADQLRERKQIISGKEEYRDEEEQINLLLKLIEDNEEVDEDLIR